MIRQHDPATFTTPKTDPRQAARQQRGVATLTGLLHAPQRFDAILDVRSPAEFADDHIPGARSCPVLDDAQRIEIGTLYKQVSPFAAKKLGAAYVSANIARHLQESFQQYEKDWRPLVLCWRGGQRSGAMTTVLRSIGWDACQLEGGYKAFRTHVLTALTEMPRQFRFQVLAGPTGSGKTRILQAIAEQGGQVLDLETLARHKGSILGRVPGAQQPSQKSFETAIWHQLTHFDAAHPVFVEAESRKIGQLRLPDSLYQAMQTGHFFRIQAPVAARIDFLLQDYDYFLCHPEELAVRLDFLRPLRGHAQVDRWQQALKQGEFVLLVDSLLKQHYDLLYGPGLVLGKTMERAMTDIPVTRLVQSEMTAAATRILDRACLNPTDDRSETAASEQNMA